MEPCEVEGHEPVMRKEIDEDAKVREIASWYRYSCLVFKKRKENTKKKKKKRN